MYIDQYSGLKYVFDTPAWNVRDIISLISRRLTCHRQRAIKRYFKQKSAQTSVQPHDNTQNARLDETGNDGRPQDREILLSTYWKGQQLSSSVTGKYLGPMCEAITGSTGLETYSINFDEECSAIC